MPATKTTNGLALTCPFCGAHDSNITLNLNDLSRIECADCSEEFTVEQARDKVLEQLAAWTKVLRMIEVAGE